MGWAVRTLFVLSLFACATPDYAVPTLDEGRVSAAEAALVRDAMETALARRARVYDLAWPVLTANASLCEETTPRAGLVLADRKLLARLSGGLEEEALERLGVPDGLRVVHVSKGSPAASAGVRSGVLVDQVEGEAVSDPGEAAKRIKDVLKGGGEASIMAGDTTYRFAGEEACEVSVKVSTSQSLNADAVSGITIYTGLIRSLSDGALSSVIAHELAHVALDHKEKYVRNSVVTGAALVGPVLYTLARATDQALGLAGVEPDRSLTARTLRVLAPWTDAFEAEADYVGLYMHARAGGDLADAAEVFEVFGREGPGSITTRATHPLAPERLDRLAATITEIEAKRAAGEALLPERKR